MHSETLDPKSQRVRAITYSQITHGPNTII
jgi:hypothetical protein